VGHSDASGWFEIPGYVWGAGHATELPYLIPDRDNAALNANAFGDDERELARQMRGYWGAFVKSGSPNAPGQPTWSAYTPGEGPILRLRGAGETVAVPSVALRAAHNCDFWESLREWVQDSVALGRRRQSAPGVALHSRRADKGSER
jgi:carboxylesterase type B